MSTEGNGYPLKYSYLENPMGYRSLAGHILWGRKELDMTERLTHTHTHTHNLSIAAYYTVPKFRSFLGEPLDLLMILWFSKVNWTQARGSSTGLQFSSVQSLSHVRLFATPWIAARQASLSITNSRSSLRLTSIESVMPSSHLILCRLQVLPRIIHVAASHLAIWLELDVLKRLHRFGGWCQQLIKPLSYLLVSYFWGRCLSFVWCGKVETESRSCQTWEGFFLAKWIWKGLPMGGPYVKTGHCLSLLRLL